MSTLTTSQKGSSQTLLIAILLGILTMAIPYYYTHQKVQDSIREMEKNSGKNGKYVNQKAKERTEQ
jgi:hypothetical protein